MHRMSDYPMRVAEDYQRKEELAKKIREYNITAIASLKYSELTSKIDEVYEKGRIDGIHSVDTESLYDNGFADGVNSVDTQTYYNDGFEDGVNSINTQSYYNRGYSVGYTDGVNSVDTNSYYNTGYTKGYDDGYDVGIKEVVNEQGEAVAFEYLVAPLTPVISDLTFTWDKNGKGYADVSWVKSTEINLDGYYVYVNGVRYNNTKTKENSFRIYGLNRLDINDIDVRSVNKMGVMSASTWNVPIIPDLHTLKDIRELKLYKDTEFSHVEFSSNIEDENGLPTNSDIVSLEGASYYKEDSVSVVLDAF